MDGLIVTDPLGEAYRDAVAQSLDYAGMREAVLFVYQRSVPDVLAQRIAEALLLAELAGAYAVVLDNPGGELLVTMNAGWRIQRLFKKAVEWFSGRIQRAASVPVVYEFAEQPIKRAPMVAAAAQLDTANRLQKRIDVLERKQTPIPEAKREMYDLLRDLGCEPAARAPQPVIQEEVQKRFARTRSEILSLDFYRAAYPFWRYVATLDERTTQGCRALDGLTMPASDPRWVGFVPPRHWRCRAHVIAVAHSVGAQAKKTAPLEEFAGEGDFGTLIEDWEPKPGDYPADLWTIYAQAKGITSPHVQLEGSWWRKQ
mgnify:CR=1 FL=1